MRVTTEWSEEEAQRPYARLPRHFLVRTEGPDGRRPYYYMDGKRISEKTYKELWDKLVYCSAIGAFRRPSGRMRHTISGVIKDDMGGRNEKSYEGSHA